MEAQLQFDFDFPEVVNVATVPQRSPFRYPGGKTWLVPTIRRYFDSLEFRPKLFVDPFAGGGIIPLTVAFEKRAYHVVMGEIDPHVSAVWRTILCKESAEWLAKEILSFRMTRMNVVAALATRPQSDCEVAFQTVLRNRVQRGGILAPGAGLVKHGENGRGISSRWYPATLAKRIIEINEIAERITFCQEDAFTLIGRYLRNRSAVFFLDPPYTAGGKKAGARLYVHNKLDHGRLFETIARARGSAILTYDESDEVACLAQRHQFATMKVAMKSTHHAKMQELVIVKQSHRPTAVG